MANPLSILARISPILTANQWNSNLFHVQNYLRQFGYLKSGEYEEGVLDQKTSEALKKYQTFFNLNKTGFFDLATRDSMISPRCGLPDSSPVAFQTNCKWENKSELTYAFGVQTPDVTGNGPSQAVRNAFNTWQTHILLNFREVSSTQSPDIFIEWRNGNVQDSDYTLTNSILAHADYPPKCSVVTNSLPKPVHFNEAFNWCIGAIRNKYDIESVALHEIGHILGIYHSTIAGAVMAPNISDNTIIRNLSQDDIDAAQALYGKRPPFTTNKFFIHFMDAFVHDDGDDFSEGELFFTFKLGNEIIAFEPPQNAQGVSSGGWLVVTGDRLIERTSEQSFTVSGIVKEDDDFATGAVDNAGSFSDTYSGANGWWPGAEVGRSKTFSHRLRGDGLDVTINYSINYVSSENSVIIPPTPHPPDPNAFGGVVVYQNVNFNESDGLNDTTRFRVPVKSQFFSEGEYDLPFRGDDLAFPFSNIILPNSISSIKVATSYTIEVFDKPLSERASGNSLFINESVRELTEWNDKIMSFIVTLSGV